MRQLMHLTYTRTKQLEAETSGKQTIHVQCNAEYTYNVMRNTRTM